ncbi:hypothetical protein FJ364_01650 [Candidatus Dependentiae bacterium]|nr:hypothetical protein [Candidatus Dependentiae bacterium]
MNIKFIRLFVLITGVVLPSLLLSDEEGEVPSLVEQTFEDITEKPKDFVKEEKEEEVESEEEDDVENELDENDQDEETGEEVYKDEFDEAPHVLDDDPDYRRQQPIRKISWWSWLFDKVFGFFN